jgi:hypothetical protein
VLLAVTLGEQGFVERCNGVEFIQLYKITVKMLQLFFANLTITVRHSENCEFFGDLKTLNYSV